MRRELSLPPDGHKHISPTHTSYACETAYCTIPKATAGRLKASSTSRRRHPHSADKKAVPKLHLRKASGSGAEPSRGVARNSHFTAGENDKAYTFVSVLLRPIVRPEIPGYCEERSMEVRFFAPGSLVANVDFVESIFGKLRRYPSFPKRCVDRSRPLDRDDRLYHPRNRTSRAHQKDLGLPHWVQATDAPAPRGHVMARSHRKIQRQGGLSRSLTRDESGVSSPSLRTTISATRKRRVKSHISYSAQPDRPRRGSARGRRPGLSLLQPRHALCARH
jgi:hypothetical protein